MPSGWQHDSRTTEVMNPKQPRPITDEAIARSLLIPVETLRAHPEILAAQHEVRAARAKLRADMPTLDPHEKKERRRALTIMEGRAALKVFPLLAGAFDDNRNNSPEGPPSE